MDLLIHWHRQARREHPNWQEYQVIIRTAIESVNPSRRLDK